MSAAERLPFTAEGSDIEMLTPPAARDREQAPSPASGATAPGATESPSPGTSRATAPSGAPQQIGEKPDRPTAQEVSLRDQQVLLNRGQLTTELRMFYLKNEQDELALLPANMGAALARVEQDTFLSIYTLRYGLLNDLQFFASAPLVHQTNSRTIRNPVVISGSGTGTQPGDLNLDLRGGGAFAFILNPSPAVVRGNRSRTDTHWGNVSVGLRYGLLAQGPGYSEGPGYPEVIATIVGLVPTGRNSASVGSGLAFVKSLDPAVLFANFNYRRVLRDGRFVNLTRLFPEAKDVFNATVGYVFALNDTLTLNASVTGFFTPRTKFQTILPPSTARINGILNSQEQLSLQLGFTVLVAENLYVEPIVSFDLTGTGSSALVGLSIPYTFEF